MTERKFVAKPGWIIKQPLDRHCVELYFEVKDGPKAINCTFFTGWYANQADIIGQYPGKLWIANLAYHHSTAQWPEHVCAACKLTSTGFCYPASTGLAKELTAMLVEKGSDALLDELEKQLGEMKS